MNHYYDSEGEDGSVSVLLSTYDRKSWRELSVWYAKSDFVKEVYVVWQNAKKAHEKAPHKKVMFCFRRMTIGICRRNCHQIASTFAMMISCCRSPRFEWRLKYRSRTRRDWSAFILEYGIPPPGPIPRTYPQGITLSSRRACLPMGLFSWHTICFYQSGLRIL